MKFSKEDTLFFKGIGILLIVFHNYLHWIPGFGLENEMGLNVQNTQQTVKFLSEFNIQNFITTLFAFFGHYGVQIFILFSAYGLTIQYSKKKQNPTQFVIRKLKKIYYLLIFAVVFCILFFIVTGLPISKEDILFKFLLVASTLSSFTQATVFDMFSGPYWFFALIVQFYVIFPLLYKIMGTPTIKRFLMILLICYLIIYPLYFFAENPTFTIFNRTTSFSTFGSMIGHLPEAFLGIYLAKGGKLPKLKILILPAFVLFCATQFTDVLFPLSFLLICIILIAFGLLLQKIHWKPWIKTIEYIGVLSMMLFVVNGPLRNLVYSDLSRFDLAAFSHSIYLNTLLVYTVILFVLSELLTRVFDWGRKALKL